jgi:hypothetical protein
MNWRRGGKISAVYGLFGALVFGGCAGGGNNAGLAAGSMASAARQVSVLTKYPKLDCDRIDKKVDSVVVIGSRGRDVRVTAKVGGNNQTVALLNVPAGAVPDGTEFTVGVHKGNRAFASVKAKVGKKDFKGPFGPEGLHLTIYYGDRNCTLNGTPAGQVALGGYSVPSNQVGSDDPDTEDSIDASRDNVSITLNLKHLSGYILAQGLLEPPPPTLLPTSPPPPPDTARSPAP